VNTWLASFQAEWQGACSEEHMLILSPDEQLAEAGCMLMGRTWWKGDPRERVAMTACMRKLITIINAIIRDGEKKQSSVLLNSDRNVSLVEK
jgi:hypothetical protein